MTVSTRSRGAVSAPGTEKETKTEANIGFFELGYPSKYDCILLIIFLAELVIAPYTKVEESFNAQAMHDILVHGPSISKYDHNEYPGVVPRTFIGAVIVAVLSAPVHALLRWAGAPLWYSLVAVRAVLGTLVWYSTAVFRRQAHRVFGKPTALAMLALLAVQFHFCFYSTRPLPNTFSMAIVLLAYALILARRHLPAVLLLGVAAVVFRSELLIMLGPLGLMLLATRRLRWTAIPLGLLTVLCAVLVSVGVDSVFWGRLIYPEGEVFWFNTILNKSGDWGVSPVYWYVTNALPRASLLAFPLFCLSVVVPRWYSESLYGHLRPRSATFPLYFIILSYVGLYSILPHKELRFVLYVVPLMTLLGAAFAVRTAQRLVRRSGLWRPLLAFAAAAGVLGSAAVVAVFVAAARINYPGAEALRMLHASVEQVGEPVAVHLDILPKMTGITRFQKINDHLHTYYKGEEELLPGCCSKAPFRLTDNIYTHLLTGHARVKGYEQLANVTGFSGLSLVRSFPFIAFQRDTVVYVHRRKDLLLDGSEEGDAQVRSLVRDKYSAIAEEGEAQTAPGTPSAEYARRLGYEEADTAGAAAGANLGLGCGNPRAVATLRAGDRVLDLGSGAGYDALLASKEVGPKGWVTGVDMTPEMVSRATRHAERHGYSNVEFHVGLIERLPIVDESMDVVISNCVINLSPDKAAVFREAYRVLKPGGRLALTDIVAIRPMPTEFKQSAALLTGCISGAAQVEELKAIIREAGFLDVEITVKEDNSAFYSKWAGSLDDASEYVVSAYIEGWRPYKLDEEEVKRTRVVEEKDM